MGKAGVRWTMRDRETGEVRSGMMHECWLVDPSDHENVSHLLFHWLENNNSCDCNRVHAFYPDTSEEIVRAAGATDTCRGLMPDRSGRSALLKLEVGDAVLWEGEQFDASP